MGLNDRIEKLVNAVEEMNRKLEDIMKAEGNPHPGATPAEKRAYAKNFLMKHGYSEGELSKMSDESLMKLMYTIERKIKDEKKDKK